MTAWLIDSAVRMRRLVVALVIAVLAFGLVQLQSAKVDVYPEFQATQVQVQAEALGLSAQEVEQLITVPIEQDLLNGVPWLKSISSSGGNTRWCPRRAWLSNGPISIQCPIIPRSATYGPVSSALNCRVRFSRAARIRM